MYRRMSVGIRSETDKDQIMAPDAPNHPLDPNTSGADPEQLRLAQVQGRAYGRALGWRREGGSHEVHGCRFVKPVEVEFTGVSVERGAD